MTILLIETATPVCSVALSCDGAIVAERHSDSPNAHSSLLSLFIRDVMDSAGVPFGSLDAVCVSSGPGSYTGLRIGVSSAKGICYALGIPLLSVPTLQNMASLYFASHPDFEGLVCPMIDARRMECYTAFYGGELKAESGEGRAVKEVRATAAEVIGPGIYDTYLDKCKVVFIGDGASKTREILSVHPNALFDDTFAISATGMSALAEERLREGKKEDVAYFEPFYLKDFIAKKSVVHGLRPEN